MSLISDEYFFTCKTFSTDDVETSITEVHHENEKPTVVNGYQEPGSYVRQIIYPVKEREQFDELIERSDKCEQYIRYKCWNSRLLSDAVWFNCYFSLCSRYRLPPHIILPSVLCKLWREKLTLGGSKSAAIARRSLRWIPIYILKVRSNGVLLRSWWPVSFKNVLLIWKSGSAIYCIDGTTLQVSR